MICLILSLNTGCIQKNIDIESNQSLKLMLGEVFRDIYGLRSIYQDMEIEEINIEPDALSEFDF